MAMPCEACCNLYSLFSILYFLKRIMRHILIILLAILFFSGCTPAQPTTISFMIFGDPAEKAAYEELVAAFQQDHKDIQVQLVHIPGQSDYRKRLGIDFAAGTPADVVLINYRRYAAYAAEGALEPLGPYLERSNLLKATDFYPQTLEPFRWNGSLTCIPQNLSSLVVYYNKSLFDAAGLAYPADDWTWDDFVTTARTLTIDSDGDGVREQHGLGTEASFFRLAPFIWQNGGELVDNPATPTGLALHTPAAKEAAQWFVDLQVKHKVVPNRVEEQAEASESRFLNGRLAMYLNSRRGVPTYRTIEAFDWDVAPLPKGRQAAGILHADAYCMPALSKQKGAAWTFIEFANSAAGQTIIAGSGRTVPSLRAVAESPAFLDRSAKPYRSNVFLDSIAVIRAVPIMANWASIEDAVGKEIERAYYGEASLDEAITAAEMATKEFFAQ
jgi:multiple sugar transport system substrate-binding protein